MEVLHPETKVWETFTPYFEKRNIHFYLNKCGFKIVEFFTAQHPLDLPPQNGEEEDGSDERFRFVKVMEGEVYYEPTIPKFRDPGPAPRKR